MNAPEGQEVASKPRLLGSFVSFLQRRETMLTLVALGLVVIVMAALLALRPETVSVAVPERSPVLQTLEAWSKLLDMRRSEYRIRVVKVAGFAQAADALQRNRVGIAVVRADFALPENGLSMAILEQPAGLLFAVPSAKIESISDLAGRRIAVVGGPETAEHFARLFFRALHADAVEPEIRLMPPEGAGAAVAQKLVDAVLVVMPPANPETRARVRQIERAANTRLTLMAVENAEALTAAEPVLESVTVPAGSFGGPPARPEEEITTLGASIRLMARSDLPRDTVAELTRLLFEMRTPLAKRVPAANRLAAPESSTSALLPLHPGAIDYLDREQQTFMEQYGDWIYIGGSLLGGLISAAAALGERFVRKRRERIDAVLRSLLGVLSAARRADDEETLDGLTDELDRLVVSSVEQTLARTTDTRTMSALVLATDSARAAIADRRRQLQAGYEPHPVLAAP